MILLLGGTSETAAMATLLAETGYKVLVSTATDIALDVGQHPAISRRTGPLDGEQMAALIRSAGVQAIVDATHPYAVNVKAIAQRASREAGVPYFALLRPTAVRPDDSVHLASTHEEAAAKACAFGRPILLTTGSRHLVPYVREARRTGCLLFVRVLPEPASLEACRDAGIPPEAMVTARGPFSVAENGAAIRQHRIGVLVTKDSGAEGGVPAKLEAASAEGCQVVVVARPQVAPPNCFPTPKDLLAALGQAVRP